MTSGVNVFERNRMYREDGLRTCLEELGRTGDLERLQLEYPQFTEQMQSFWDTLRLLEGAVPQLEDEKLLTLKHEFLTVIATRRPKRVFGMLPVRLAGLLGIGGVLVAASLGASAAGLGPALRAGGVLESMGVSRSGQVSDAVQGAIDGSSPGSERGEAVSAAACEAAHDRSTLPQGAQDAAGQESKEAKDCSKSNEKSDNAAEQANGTASAQGVQSTEPGPERGSAACTAAMEDPAIRAQAAENAAAQATGQNEPGCHAEDAEDSGGESGQGSGGKPADLPTSAGRP
jgi:hypothetical protein